MWSAGLSRHRMLGPIRLVARERRSRDCRSGLGVAGSVPVTVFHPAVPMPPDVNIVGFLQLFVDYVEPTEDVHAHILNVSGCGNNGSGTVASGGGSLSPIPVRLIHN